MKQLFMPTRVSNLLSKFSDKIEQNRDAAFILPKDFYLLAHQIMPNDLDSPKKNTLSSDFDPRLAIYFKESMVVAAIITLFGFSAKSNDSKQQILLITLAVTLLTGIGYHLLTKKQSSDRSIKFFGDENNGFQLPVCENNANVYT